MLHMINFYRLVLVLGAFLIFVLMIMEIAVEICCLGACLSSPSYSRGPSLIFFWKQKKLQFLTNFLSCKPVLSYRMINMSFDVKSLDAPVGSR